MTTIAYKDGILAADTQLSMGNIRMSCHKIITIRKGFVYAACGNVRDDADFSAYLRAIEATENPQEVERPVLGGGFEAIVLRDGVPFFSTGKKGGAVLTHLSHPYHAIGSGWQLAMAGMALDMSAYDAVEFACRLDINSSLPIDIYDSTKDSTKTTISRRKTRAKRASSSTQNTEGG